MSIFNGSNPLLTTITAATGGGYEIERSLRFNSADSAYLSKTFASAGNRTTWTWSSWVKLVDGDFSVIFCNKDPYVNNNRFLHFSYNNQRFAAGLYDANLITSTGTYRDYSAWYHLMFVADTTNSQVRLYVNGVLETTATTSANYELGINQANTEHLIGLYGRYHLGEPYYSDFYLADIHFIDGQALDPSSFGAFDSNGIWQPIEYTGTYGTNGFHLPFSDNSTAAALGTDTAGSNDWTVNNISVTAGAGNDSLVDVPTNGTEEDTGVGGEVRGNYATWNPLKKYSTVTLSNGNLDNSTIDGKALATIGMSSGKWYCEVAITSGPVNPGLARDNTQLTAGYLGDDASSWCYASNGSVYTNNGGTSYGNSFTSGDIIGIAFDADAGSLYFYKNGVVQNSGTPAFTGLTNTPYFFAVGAANSTSSANFGQRPFAYTAPSGFKALCTANLDAPVVTKPSEYMDIALYTGNGSTQTISGLEFSPDLVWIKNRAAAGNHKLLDTVRGATEELESNTTDAEATNADGLTAFNSDGFDLGADAEYNTNTETYVAWNWDAGSSNATNTDGSITSTVRANPTAGFSIVTYTGNAILEATVGHGLGAAPKIVIIKNRSVVDNWIVYTSAIDGSSDFLILNLENNKADWGITNATSTVFSVGNGSNTNGSGNDMLAYCFAPVDGYSSIGTYIGTGTADGPFVYTGFRPKWILIKCTNSGSTENWRVFDSERLGYNVNNYALYPSVGAGGEVFSEFLGDILSNGFKLRNPSVGTNVSGATHLYAAFAENPFALNARAR